MGITDICTPASFSNVRSPESVYVYQLLDVLEVLDEYGQPSGLDVTVVESMAQVVVPDGRSVYWREPSLINEPDQLHLYGSTVSFVVQWVSDTAEIAFSTLNSTNVILIGGDNTALRFRVTAVSLIESSTAILEAELSVENVVAVNGTEGRPTRKLMLLTLADVKLLLLPASFDDQSHISRSFLSASLLLLSLLLLKFDTSVGVLFVSGGRGIVKIHFRSNPRWRTAPKLEMIISR